MDLLESEFYLSSILEGRVSKTTLSSISPLLYELNNLLKLDYSDICYICYCCPDILEHNIYSIISNLNELKKTYNISSREIRYLFLKYPRLLLVTSDILKFKINLISTIFDFSSKDAFRMLYTFPELFYLEKNQVKKQIELISSCFDEYGIVVRKHFRREPRLLFVTKENIECVRKYLMRNCTLTENEVHKVFKTVPSVALMKLSEIEEFFNSYYPTYFVKRDIKEILNACPEFINLNPNSVKSKIEEIKSIFNIDQKRACELVRKIPNILFYESCYDKIKGFSKFSISLEYLKNFPEICLAPEISLPINYIITRILKLEQNFDLISIMDTNLFVSRFLFMQSYGFTKYQDLLIKEDEFEKKYHISSKVLKVSYRLDYKTLDNICKYYLNLKGKINNWVDIVFPEYSKIINYMYGTGLEKNQHPRILSYFSVREKENITKTRFMMAEILKNYELNSNEIKMILNKFASLSPFIAYDLNKNILLLKKYGCSQEDIVLLLLNKPSLFAFSVKDFATVLEVATENANVKVEEVLSKLIF